jgi:cytidine deaminase
MKNEELLLKAKDAAKNAYCPYSKFHVGACVEYENGNIYQGCNVENGSYTVGICAERNAISTAIAAGEQPNKLVRVAIYSPDTKMCWPCGACRQWFSEFEQGQNLKIIVEDKNGNPIEFTVEELLPHRFELIP